MKYLILLSLLSSGTVFSKCIINLVKKTATTKTAYTLSGESISISVINKLKSQCTFNVRLMTLAEKRRFEIARLTARLNKLQR